VSAEPTARQYAIRNALRIFDAIPMFYASGLVAIMWSGPALRQRMGDRVAGTAVILEPNARTHNTAHHKANKNFESIFHNIPNSSRYTTDICVELILYNRIVPYR